MTGADVLIVVPSLNEEAHIKSVIATLQADGSCSEALIVVSDGCSSDQTVSIVEGIRRTDPRVHLLTSVKRLNTSASVNRAVKCFGAGRKWLVRLDAHAGYPKNYVSRLVAKAIETGATSVVTPMFTQGKTCFERAAAAAQN
jgi:succinoglycan biosynthesis protein ExoA